MSLAQLLMGPLGMSVAGNFRQAEEPEPQGYKPTKGQMIAGIIGDALAAAGGGAPRYTQMMMAERQRANERQSEEVQWRRNQQAMRDNWLFQQQYQRDNPDPSPMQRDARAWLYMTPQEQEAFKAMKQAGEGDPIVTITLPNNQVYSGPRSGLAQALGGSNPRPVGKLTPINGGPTPPASGNFPDPLRPY